ncbi:MAG: di-heme oxidoredictase family protein [Sandaracinaceae bacterium]
MNGRAWWGLARCALGLCALTLTGCPNEPEPAIPDNIFGELGEVGPWATEEQRATFERGQAVALHHFGVHEGIGPHYNVSFCGSCHERPTLGGSSPRYRNFLLVSANQEGFPQAPLGVNGVQTQFELTERRTPTPEGTNVSATRNAIPFFGAGLMAEIPGESILANADPDDLDGDGISGRPNYDETFVGRFGRKSQTVSVEGFIRGPLFNHIGITTDPLSETLKAQLPVPSAPADVSSTREGLTEDDIGGSVEAQVAAPAAPITDDDPVMDPELSEQDLFDLVAFSMLLAAPRPDAPTAETQRGREIFDEMNCIGCHVHTLESPRGLIPLYSDLLLHDMGPDLADGIQMKQASGSEFRTQPLWGIAAVAPYLHDGRADTLDDAIRFHGGEAQAARDAYVNGTDEDRRLVIAFLESLGGRAQRSPGLIPVDEPPPAEGEYGGAMPGTDAVLFERGRRVFDRDFGLHVGLGRPGFNGDSCRACHSLPAIGGAGPVDLNVTRQAILVDGVPMLPSGGTMAHRQSAHVGERPPIDAASDFFELRQTPPLFGLGLVDLVPEDVILANEDPDDLDGDGVRGRANILADGRVGRLGWRANVPSLAEFTRDGMTNEMGISLPDQPGLTFGSATDTDDVPDPEISVDELESVTFYMTHLAPPPRVRTDPALEDMGEALFESIGCATCHRSLTTEDGTEVALYSDLLLHVVMPDGEQGIGDGDVTGREFRTTPLWGVSQTGPYMHDGLADTIEDAIARHFGEAGSAAEAYGALSMAEREAVLAFLRSL